MAKHKSIGQRIKKFFVEVGELGYFTGHYFRQALSPPFEFNELLRQCYLIGNRSLLLVGVTGFILGLVFTLQSRPTLMEFGAESWMPSMVSISIVREIGPVITALICAGRIGSGIGAELGSMRVTEQIDAICKHLTFGYVKCLLSAELCHSGWLDQLRCLILHSALGSCIDLGWRDHERFSDLSKTEVNQLRLKVVVNEHVLELEVAVHHT